MLQPNEHTTPASATRSRLVVIGASAGAVEALSEILPKLRSPLGAAVVVVVHVPDDAGATLASLFAARCSLRAKEAEDKEPIENDTIYFAPAGYHLLVERRGVFSLSADPPVMFSRPSIDVLFESAADAFGGGCVGLILSGANEDGASGLATLCAAGGSAIVQDPATALAHTMPQAARTRCASAVVLQCSAIAGQLEKLLRATTC